MNIWVLRSKHGDIFYKANTVEEKEASALKIVKENHYNEYYQGDTRELAEIILDLEDGKRAHKFVMERTAYEYEEIYEEELT